MYLSKELKTRMRAALLAGILMTAPGASALTPDTAFSISNWLQQLISSIVTMTSVTEDEEPCTCGAGSPDCGNLHLPGG